MLSPLVHRFIPHFAPYSIGSLCAQYPCSKRGTSSSDQWAVKKVNKYVLLLGYGSENPHKLSSPTSVIAEEACPTSVIAEEASYLEKKNTGLKQLDSGAIAWRTGTLKSHLDMQMILH